ncbi:MAG: TAXI family TRAP transporter solute-binding subunit [Thermoanaerobaculia bacterium]
MGGKGLRWFAGIVFLGVVVWALFQIGPAVPREIRLLTGPEGTTFHEDGLRYREVLARHGIEVRVETTGGSIENLRGVAEAEVPTAGFVWGLWDPSGQQREPPEGIRSLGTMGLQPLWLFVRRDLAATGFAALRGARVEAGRDGSDARLLAFLVFREEGVGEGIDFGQTHPVTPEEVEAALDREQLAAIMTAGTPDSRWIDGLLRSPRLQVMSIRRAAAFALRFPFLEVVRFPEGGHDLRANLPDHDLQLLAARTQLIVSDHFPPALTDLLLQAAAEIHGNATRFSAHGQFPRPESTPLTLHRAARNYYEHGPSKLQAFLPFRLATWLNRFAVSFVAVASAAVTLFNVLPALIGLPFRRRLRQGFSDLRAIERSAAAGAARQGLLDRLADVDRTTAGIRIPLRSLEPQWLELRQYLHDLRERLDPT